MSLESEPVAASFRSIGTDHTILATDPAALAPAVELAQAHLAELDLAASRFREDSEVSVLACAARQGPVSTRVSPLLASYLAAALQTAQDTAGLVDPTVGSALIAAGYDVDIDIVRARTGGPAGLPLAATGRRSLVPGWQHVALDGTRLSLPAGCVVDLGASAKAHAADVVATALTQALPGGFLVNLGGDIAVSGTIPGAGWRIGVEDVEGRTLQTILSTGHAVTTSSTRHRRWQVDGVARHHIVDPRTGEVAPSTWDQVTCVADTALAANAASTAAIILGTDAPAWLAARGIPARLDAADGSVTTTPGWPAP